MNNIDIDKVLTEFFGDDYHKKIDAKNMSRLKDKVEKLTIEGNIYRSDVSDGLIFFNNYPEPDYHDDIRISEISREVHRHNVKAGWWSDIHTGERIKRNKHELLGLISSELFEAFNGARKNMKDDHLPQYDALCVEMADALIRIFDYAGQYNINPFYIMEDRLASECRITLKEYPESYQNMSEKLKGIDYLISDEALYQLDLMKNFASKKTSLHSNDSDGNIFSQMFRISAVIGMLSFVELNNGDNKEIENIVISSTFLMILDFCDRCNLDIINAIVDKLAYNKTRLDHKRENRLKDGGKLI